MARRAGDADRAPVLFDDAVHRGQAQARALAAFLGGEERFEQARARLLVDAVPGIRDAQHAVRARLELQLGVRLCTLHARDADLQPAAGLAAWRLAR